MTLYELGVAGLIIALVIVVAIVPLNVVIGMLLLIMLGILTALVCFIWGLLD